MVEVQGAGGAATKSATNGNRNGGGGGGYAKKLLDVSSISSATITVGAGGAGSTSNDTKGGDGGDSSWADGTNTITGSGGDAAETVVINWTGWIGYWWGCKRYWWNRRHDYSGGKGGNSFLGLAVNLNMQVQGQMVWMVH